LPLAIALFMAGRARSEAVVTLQIVERPQPSEVPTPPAAAKRLLAFAIQHANEPPVPTGSLAREFRVDVLRNQNLLLVCKAETPELAVDLCGRTSKEATATGLFLGIEHARETTPVARRAFDAAWPAILAAFGWFLVRTSFNPRSSGDEELPSNDPNLREWQRWTVPNRATPGNGAFLNAPIARRVSQAPRPAGRIVNTMVGMPAVVPAGAPRAMATPVPMRDSSPARKSGPDLRTTARMIRAVSPEAQRARSEAPRPPTSDPPEGERRRISTAPDLSRRVLYQVNTGPWVADPVVVNDAVLEQLATLRDEFARGTNPRGRVIRVTSGANSRYAKTQAATQLAWLLAERKENSVLIMEADLDAPALHKTLRVNVPRGFGFSEQLERLGEDTTGESGVTLMRLGHGLHALVEGRSGTPSLYDSPQFSAALSQLRNEHDLIVIDGPVVDTWPDSRSLQGVADAVVFIVAAGTQLSEAATLTKTHFESHPMLRVLKTGEWQD
jgi:Mrp family chromosome partitioning ATPase